jgi:hypothetical protein
MHLSEPILKWFSASATAQHAHHEVGHAARRTGPGSRAGAVSGWLTPRSSG